MKYTLDLVIFDLVGTTIDDSGNIHRTAWHKAYEKFGGEKSKTSVEVREEFKENLYELLTSTYQVPGTRQTLEFLKNNNIKIGVTAEYNRKAQEICIANSGFGDLVDAAVCATNVNKGRPAPYMIHRVMKLTNTHDVRRVMNIGDTKIDIIAAQNAGVISAGVLTGQETKQTYTQLAKQPDHILKSIASLPILIQTQYPDIEIFYVIKSAKNETEKKQTILEMNNFFESLKSGNTIENYHTTDALDWLICTTNTNIKKEIDQIPQFPLLNKYIVTRVEVKKEKSSYFEPHLDRQKWKYKKIQKEE